MDKVNEQTTAWIRITLLDREGLPATPTAVVYRIDDVATGVEIRETTAVDPAPVVEIRLSPDDNRIIGGAYQDQKRLLTVRANYGDGDMLHAEYGFTVKNLLKVPLST